MTIWVAQLFCCWRSSNGTQLFLFKKCILASFSIFNCENISQSTKISLINVIFYRWLLRKGLICLLTCFKEFCINHIFCSFVRWKSNQMCFLLSSHETKMMMILLIIWKVVIAWIKHGYRIFLYYCELCLNCENTLIKYFISYINTWAIRCQC